MVMLTNPVTYHVDATKHVKGKRYISFQLKVIMVLVFHIVHRYLLCNSALTSQEV